MVSTAYNTHQRQFVHSDDFYFQRTRRLKVKKRLTQRAPDPRQITPGLAWWESARFQAVCVA
jgi:hypothetical protein